MPRPSSTTPSIACGVYQHFKGARYQVLGQVRHSETAEAMVLYRALYGDFDLWVRPVAMFTQTVEVDGRPQPRFMLLQEIHESPPSPP